MTSDDVIQAGVRIGMERARDIFNPGAFRASVERGLRHNYGQEVERLVEKYPHARPEQLAAFLFYGENALRWWKPEGIK